MLLAAKSGPGLLLFGSCPLLAAAELVQRTILRLFQVAFPPPLAILCKELTFEGGTKLKMVKADLKFLLK